MSITNKFIGSRIREARNQRGKTQTELANHLGKTTGAVSQLEMGNVQVSVVELDKLSKYLNKPIEFFYGEDYLGDDVLALIAIFRKMDIETRAKQAESIRTMLEMQELSDLIFEADEKDDEAKMKELGIQFFQKLVPFISDLQEMSAQGKDIQDKLGKVLAVDEIQNIILVK